MAAVLGISQFKWLVLYHEWKGGPLKKLRMPNLWLEAQGGCSCVDLQPWLAQVARPLICSGLKRDHLADPGNSQISLDIIIA
eukprot:9930095-Karenia_brevis.AAC.1